MLSRVDFRYINLNAVCILKTSMTNSTSNHVYWQSYVTERKNLISYKGNSERFWTKVMNVNL